MKKILLPVLIVMTAVLCVVLSACAGGILPPGKQPDVPDDISMETVYAYAVEAGYTGTMEELIEAFKGDSAYVIACEKGFVGTEEEWLNSLKGKDGVTPNIGENGHWWIGAVDTGVAAAGKDGVGIKTIVYKDGKFILTMTDDKDVEVDYPTCSHKYGSWTDGLAATCTSIGYNYRVCEICENIEYEFIEKTGHKGKNFTVDTDAHSYFCTMCGIYVQELHTYDDDYSCTVCETGLYKVHISHTVLGIIAGETYCLTAITDPVGGIIKWVSSNPNVATVDEDGKVSGVSEGSAIITASCGSASAACKVTVGKGASTVEYYIMLSIENLDLMVNDTYVIMADSIPTDAIVSWASSNTSVAVVDEDGKVYGIAPGIAVIIAACGNASACCVVTVHAEEGDIEPTDQVVLSSSGIALTIGRYYDLVASSTGEITWITSNNKVAYIDASGRITAIDKGSAIIVATCGTAAAACKVVVSEEIDGEYAIWLDRTNVELSAGECSILSIVEMMPVDVSITWASSNPSVATVDRNGQVTALRAGVVVITATCGNAVDYCTVCVRDTGIESEDYVALSSYEMVLCVGQHQDMTVSSSGKAVWASSDGTIATVDSNGRITARRKGAAVITATCGSVSAACKIWVENSFEAEYEVIIMDSEESFELEIGERYVLICTYTPVDMGATWISSNPSVATVDQSGIVTAIGSGTAVISAVYGNSSACCNVTVTDAEGEIEPMLISAWQLILKEGKTKVLDVTATGEVTWRSSNTYVATVDQNGQVSAIRAGVAVITATCGSASVYCTVTVVCSEMSLEYTLVISAVELRLEVGNNYTLVAVSTPTGAPITWISSNPSVAAVYNGYVIGMKPGSAIITAICGNASVSCVAYISEKTYSDDKITLSKTEIELEIGYFATLSCSANGEVTWISSNPSVAAVDPTTGKVVAVGEGTAIICATCGNASEYCMVRVYQEKQKQ